jgi:hypothetical protein
LRDNDSQKAVPLLLLIYVLMSCECTNLDKSFVLIAVEVTQLNG